MSLSRAEVERIAHLARLQLSDAQLDTYQTQLSAILDAVDALAALDLEGVPPTTHAIPNVNRMRQDRADEPLPVETALANAPQQADDQFVIQAVLDDA